MPLQCHRSSSAAQTLRGRSVQELLLLVADAERGYKREATQLLRSQGFAAIYPVLEAAVRNDDQADLRNGAMETLVAFGEESVPRLRLLLRDDNEEVRNFSAVMLGEIGSRLATGALIEALTDPDPNVAQAAAEALGKIGDPAAGLALIELLQGELWVQFAAVSALGALREKKAIPHLHRLLDNDLLAIAAAEALGQIAGPRPLPALGVAPRTNQAPSPDASMQPAEFALLRELVREWSGIVLEEGKEEQLARKLRPRLEELGLQTFSEYYRHLKYRQHAGQERQQLISLITNNETYFFREEPQLRVLSDEILPRLNEAKLRIGKKSIHILSAGCSSGEEAYTLAMLLKESGLFGNDWELQVTGVDLDVLALERARTGVYPPNSFRSAAPPFLERYLKRCADRMVVLEELRNCTSFLEGNLLTLSDAIPAGIDIIFCRNVLIYFSEESSRSAIANFTALLAPEGWLFLGHSESLTRISGDYLPHRFPGAIIYQKRG